MTSPLKQAPDKLTDLPGMVKLVKQLNDSDPSRTSRFVSPVRQGAREGTDLLLRVLPRLGYDDAPRKGTTGAMSRLLKALLN